MQVNYFTNFYVHIYSYIASTAKSADKQLICTTNLPIYMDHIIAQLDEKLCYLFIASNRFNSYVMKLQVQNFIDTSLHHGQCKCTGIHLLQIDELILAKTWIESC